MRRKWCFFVPVLHDWKHESFPGTKCFAARLLTTVASGNHSAAAGPPSPPGPHPRKPRAAITSEDASLAQTATEQEGGKPSRFLGRAGTTTIFPFASDWALCVLFSQQICREINEKDAAATIDPLPALEPEQPRSPLSSTTGGDRRESRAHAGLQCAIRGAEQPHFLHQLSPPPPPTPASSQLAPETKGTLDGRLLQSRLRLQTAPSGRGGGSDVLWKRTWCVLAHG